MKNLCRALAIAFRYRWSVAGAVITSFLIAGTWGSNLAAVYPFVEVIFDGQTLPSWSAEKVADLQSQISVIDTELAQSPTPASTSKLEDRRYWLAYRYEALQSAIPYINQWAPTTPFGTLCCVIAFTLSMTLTRCVLLGANLILVKRISQGVVFYLQNELFRKLVGSDLASIELHGTGSLASRVQYEALNIGSTVHTVFGRLMSEPLKAMVCLAGAAAVNWRLLLVSLLICPAAFLALTTISRKIKESTRNALSDAAGLMDQLVESLTYIKAIKSYNMQSARRRDLRETTQTLYSQQVRIAWYDALLRGNNEVLGTGIICLSLLVGGYLVLTSETHVLGFRMASEPMNYGTLVLFYGLLLGTTDPLRKLGGVHLNLRLGALSADLLYRHLDETREIVSPPKPRALPKMPATIRYDAVTFGYRMDQVVLNGISFEVPPKQKLAIVGPNGCGKSTMMDLLSRFYDPTSGTISINDHSIKEYGLRDLRKYITTVSQQAALFDRSVLYNIAYGCGRVSDESVCQAAEAAGAMEFINKLPGRFDFVIGEHGGRLSGGQRQRLSLARAILRNSPVVVLDEATSQVDIESERLIHLALHTFLQDRTAIMITHRASTLSLADRILVMDAGKIVAEGTREWLLGNCDVFRKIWGETVAADTFPLPKLPESIRQKAA
jgi:ATP-binding cassette, subfamily B, bacterial MsbA